MNIIDRYVHAVAILLPEKNREDIKKELTSLIWDAMDERREGNGPDEKTASAILKELGAPSEMAKKYTGEQAAVISVHLTDLFWKVVGIAMLIMFIVVTVASAIELAVERTFSDNIVQWVIQTVSSFIETGISTFGIIALIFAGITQIKRNKGETIKEAEWDPKDLPEITDAKDSVKVSEQVVGLIFTLIGLEIFNFMPDILFSAVGSFNKAVLYEHLPLLNAALIANLIFSLAMLLRRKWTIPRRILNICLGAFALYAFAALFLDPNLLVFRSNQNEIAYGVTLGLRVMVGIIGISWFADAVGHIRKMIKK